MSKENMYSTNINIIASIPDINLILDVISSGTFLP